MNRDGRTKIRKALSAFSQEATKLIGVLEEAKDEEEEKTGNLPSAFLESRLADDLKDASEKLQEAAAQIEGITNMLDEIAEDLGIGELDHNADLIDARPAKRKKGGEKRSERFQAVFTASEINTLRRIAKENKESMNAVICRSCRPSH